MSLETGRHYSVGFRNTLLKAIDESQARRVPVRLLYNPEGLDIPDVNSPELYVTITEWWPDEDSVNAGTIHFGGEAHVSGVMGRVHLNVYPNYRAATIRRIS